MPLQLRSPFLETTLPCFASPICRLGLASRGNTSLSADDVEFALERGVNFLNWCGTPENGMNRAIAGLGKRRQDVIVCAQFEARTAADAATELRDMLARLRTEYLDVLTFYYVEAREEWEETTAPGGALEFCKAAQRDGQVRLLGLTTHQRPLAATVAASGLLDCLMIRYNAAHRGAETEVFPVAVAHGLPIIAYTALRWGALLEPTPSDPRGFVVPRAPAWYRFVLQAPAVAVALAAPDNRAELEDDLATLEADGPLSPEEFERLAEHGQRVRRHAGSFP